VSWFDGEVRLIVEDEDLVEEGMAFGLEPATKAKL
jgi:hypothetical protein